MTIGRIEGEKMLRVAILATYVHPSRIERVKERSVMQSAVPELLAALCPDHAEVEIYNEKVEAIPLDKEWDVVFFSYLHPAYEHTKTLSQLFRMRGMKTVAGGYHASFYPEECLKYFDTVMIGEPEGNLPAYFSDLEKSQVKKIYNVVHGDMPKVPPARHELVRFSQNRFRLPALEASRGCPYSCNFCVLTTDGTGKYRYRPVDEVVSEIKHAMQWNTRFFGKFSHLFQFLDNNLGGDKAYLRSLCEALIPLKKIWGCSLTFNVLRDNELLSLMAKAGCRFIYTGLESLNAESLKSMNKGQNSLKDLRGVIRNVYSKGILLGYGLMVGTDGDTNDYLKRLPDYIREIEGYFITFIGIACPYPGTGYFKQLQKEGRLLPNTTIRDYDCYTLCHRPLKLSPSETVEHYQRIVKEVTGLKNSLRHYKSKWGLSSLSRYKLTILLSALEMRSINVALKNKKRSYIGGTDMLEEWDKTTMQELDIFPQYIS